MNQSTPRFFQFSSTAFIAILFGVISLTLVAFLNSETDLAKAYFDQRQQDLALILNGFREFQTTPISHGQLPACSSKPMPDCGESFAGAIELGNNTFDCRGILEPAHIRQIPSDPEFGSGYFVCTKGQHLYIIAPNQIVDPEIQGCQLAGDQPPAMCLSG